MKVMSSEKNKLLVGHGAGTRWWWGKIWNEIQIYGKHVQVKILKIAINQKTSPN